MPRYSILPNPGTEAGWLLAGCLAIGPFILPPACPAAETAAPPDTREVYSGAAPVWLQAVGRLRVPGSTYRDGERNHLQENCSATLVTSAPGRGADTIITAWHCLENYRDLSQPIVFTLPQGNAGALQREAFRIVDGGGMHADWALLRLRPRLSRTEARAMLVHHDRADPRQVISMAGYSRDQGKGEGGNRLTFDPGCRITTQAPVLTTSDCLAHKGASGGAVVQLSKSGTPRLSGVVSEGNGSGVSTYVPVNAFRRHLNRHLN